MDCEYKLLTAWCVLYVIDCDLIRLNKTGGTRDIHMIISKTYLKMNKLCTVCKTFDRNFNVKKCNIVLFYPTLAVFNQIKSVLSQTVELSYFRRGVVFGSWFLYRSLPATQTKNPRWRKNAKLSVMSANNKVILTYRVKFWRQHVDYFSR